MADPISFLPTVLALGKTLVTIVKYLTSLRGSLRKAERHLNDAVNFQTIIDQSLQQFGRFAPWTVSEDQRVVSQLKRSHQICQAYTDLLIDIKESRLVSIKWKLKEQGVEEQAQRLERSKTSLILAISLAKSVGDLKERSFGDRAEMTAEHLRNISRAAQYQLLQSQPYFIGYQDLDPLLLAARFFEHGPVRPGPTFASMNSLGVCVDCVSTMLGNMAWVPWGPRFGAY